MGIRETFAEWDQEIVERNIIRLESFANDANVVGLEEIIFEIKNLMNLGIYERLMEVYELKNDIYETNVVREEFFRSPLIKLADENLVHPFFIRLPPFKGVVFNLFCDNYRFFEYFYYMNIEERLDIKDMRNIYYGGLGECVITFLDNFYKVKKTPEPTIEFFQNLRQVQWQKQSHNIFKKIDHTLSVLGNTIQNYTLFGGEEQLFVEFLCFCAAASDGRGEVSVDDVIKAYKTYFKLMRTDVTAYKAAESVGDADFPADNSFFEKYSFFEKFSRRLSSDALLHIWLRVWGLLFMGLGILIVFYGYYPVYLGGLFLAFAGILSFILIHRIMYLFYSGTMMGLAIILYFNGYLIQAFTFLLLSIFLFNIARVISKKQEESVSKNEKTGYLVCKSCNRYYKLQSGEKPKDFSDICECGGKLKYMKRLDGIN